MSFLTDNITELLVAGILVVVALAVMTGTYLTQNSNSVAYTQGLAMTTAIGGFATWFPLLVLVAVAVIILYRIGMFSGQKTGF